MQSLFFASHLWIPNSCLDRSVSVSWWTKRNLSKLFLGWVLPFCPATNFIPPFLHTHLIHLISSTPVMVRQVWSAGIFVIHRPIIYRLHRISSLDPTLCWTRVEDIYIFLVISLKTRRLYSL